MEQHRLLEGQVLVLSGAGPGLGRQVALAAAAHGAKVVLGARHAERLRALAEEIGVAGAEAAWTVCDIRREDECRALAAMAVERFGGVDALVNNAVTPGPFGITLEDADLDDWRATFEVNVFGSLQMSRSVLPAMRARGGGSIVFVGSHAMRRILPGRGPYASSKAALLVAAQVLSREVGPGGIRVNTVVPGALLGPSALAYFQGLADAAGTSLDEQLAARASLSSLRRIPSDEECARVVVFLCSALASAMTGQSIDVNGGETLH